MSTLMANKLAAKGPAKYEYHGDQDYSRGGSPGRYRDQEREVPTLWDSALVYNLTIKTAYNDKFIFFDEKPEKLFLKDHQDYNGITFFVYENTVFACYFNRSKNAFRFLPGGGMDPKTYTDTHGLWINTRPGWPESVGLIQAFGFKDEELLSFVYPYALARKGGQLRVYELVPSKGTLTMEPYRTIEADLGHLITFESPKLRLTKLWHSETIYVMDDGEKPGIPRTLVPVEPFVPEEPTREELREAKERFETTPKRQKEERGVGGFERLTVFDA